MSAVTFDMRSMPPDSQSKEPHRPVVRLILPTTVNEHDHPRPRYASPPRQPRRATLGSIGTTGRLSPPIVPPLPLPTLEERQEYVQRKQRITDEEKTTSESESLSSSRSPHSRMEMKSAPNTPASPSSDRRKIIPNLARSLSLKFLDATSSRPDANSLMNNSRDDSSRPADSIDWDESDSQSTG